MDFWMRLKKEIKAKNTTQDWVANKVDVHISTFRKWMSRKTYPDMREGVEIAKLLELSSEYLVTGIEPKELNNIEQRLINGYRKLNLVDQENVVLIVNAWLTKNEYKEEVPLT